jgi:hypothetical protein
MDEYYSRLPKKLPKKTSHSWTQKLWRTTKNFVSHFFDFHYEKKFLMKGWGTMKKIFWTQKESKDDEL